MSFPACFLDMILDVRVSIGHSLQERDNLLSSHVLYNQNFSWIYLQTQCVPLGRYNAAAAGSGSHVHLSIWQGASNVFMARGPGSKYGMSKLGQEFLAGVLHHLPAILAFTAPNPNRLVLSPISSSILAIVLPTQ